jgi:hypothetical protein
LELKGANESSTSQVHPISGFITPISSIEDVGMVRPQTTKVYSEINRWTILSVIKPTISTIMGNPFVTNEEIELIPRLAARFERLETLWWRQASSQVKVIHNLLHCYWSLK